MEDINLTVEDALVLTVAEEYRQSGNYIYKYWHFDYHIDDLEPRLRQLLHDGYLRLENNEEALYTETVAGIKNKFKPYLSNNYGRKEDLVNRVLDEVPSNVIEKKINNRFYKYTSKGLRASKKYEYLNWLRNHQGLTNMTAFSFYRKMNFKKNKERDFHEVILETAEKSQKKALEIKMSNSSFPQWRMDYFSAIIKKAILYSDMGQLEKAFYYCSEYIYYSLNSIESTDSTYVRFFSTQFFPQNTGHFLYEHSSLTILRLDILHNITDNGPFSEEEVRLNLKKNMTNLQSPLDSLNIFTVDECIDLFFLKNDLIYWTNKERQHGVSGPIDQIISIYESAKVKMGKIYPDIKF